MSAAPAAAPAQTEALPSQNRMQRDLNNWFSIKRPQHTKAQTSFVILGWDEILVVPEGQYSVGVELYLGRANSLCSDLWLSSPHYCHLLKQPTSFSFLFFFWATPV